MTNQKKGINTTASYFGDAELEADDIDTVVESLFENAGFFLSHDCKFFLKCFNFRIDLGTMI